MHLRTAMAKSSFGQKKEEFSLHNEEDEQLSDRVLVRCPLNLSTFTALELRNNRWETCSGCKKCAASGGNKGSPSGSRLDSLRWLLL